jgi:cyclic pyranopterin phosphate synthase
MEPPSPSIRCQPWFEFRCSNNKGAFVARKSSKARLTHVDAKGRARMVDVGAKQTTRREAVAEAFLRMRPATLRLITSGKSKKGDVLAVARLAGIQAAKRTDELIPLCHAIPLSSVGVDFEEAGSGRLRIVASAACTGQTGVEMEALCAAALAALTVYDMVKAVDRGMAVERVRLIEKKGGRSGHWKR